MHKCLFLIGHFVLRSFVFINIAGSIIVFNIFLVASLLGSDYMSFSQRRDVPFPVPRVLPLPPRSASASSSAARRWAARPLRSFHYSSRLH
jgi:hypothetical protein